jgi:hypothetical protein
VRCVVCGDRNEAIQHRRKGSAGYQQHSQDGSRNGTESGRCVEPLQTTSSILFDKAKCHCSHSEDSQKRAPRVIAYERVIEAWPHQQKGRQSAQGKDAPIERAMGPKQRVAADENEEDRHCVEGTDIDLHEHQGSANGRQGYQFNAPLHTPGSDKRGQGQE